MPDCSVESCDRPAIARSFCSAHHKRWRKHGDPHRGGPLPSAGHGRCCVEDCNDAAYAHGYCTSHKIRLDRYGDPRAGRRRRNSEPEPCSIGKCNGPAVTHGLCNNHYKRLLKHGDPLGGRPSPLRGQQLEERHAHYTDRRGADECWPWLASVDRKGYAQLQDGAGGVPAHRIAYEIAHGPIPDGQQIHHTCENEDCQNPAHLVAMEPGAHTLIGNGFSGANSRKTHCKRGHPLIPENTYDYPGRRACKTCARERAQARNERLRRRH